MLCKLEHFQSFISALKPLANICIFFRKDCIDVHHLNTAKTIVTCINYHTEVSEEFSIPIDALGLLPIKGDEVEIIHEDNKLVIKRGNIRYKCLKLADPRIEKSVKDKLEMKWDYADIHLSSEDIIDLLEVINSKEKYDIILEEGILTVIDPTNHEKPELVKQIDVVGTFESRFSGELLLDTITKSKNGINIQLGNDKLLHVYYKFDWMEVDHYIAPMLDEK